MATLAAGSARPPDRAARALPGARNSAPKITKLATSRLPTSIAILPGEEAHRSIAYFPPRLSAHGANM